MMAGRAPWSQMNAKRLLAATSVVLILGTLPTLAEPLAIDYNTEIMGTYTDNSRLTPFAQEEAYIVSGSAEVNAYGDKGRITMSNEYSLAYDHYISQGLNDLSGFRHNLRSQNVVEVLSDTFFVDLNGSVAERGANRDTVNPASQRAVTGNRVQTRAFEIRPRYSLDLTSGILSTGSISYGRVKHVNPNVGEITNPGLDRTDHDLRAELALFKNRRDSTFSWRLAGSAEKDDNDIERLRGRGSVFYQVSSRLQLIGRGGYESSNRESLSNRDIDGEFWSAGFDYLVGPRTNLRAEAGERFGERSYEFALNHRLSTYISLDARYEQGIRTDQRSALQGLSAADDGLDTVFDFGIEPTVTDAELDLVTNAYFYDEAAFALRFGNEGAFLVLTGQYLRRDFTTIDRDEEVFGGRVTGQMPLSRRMFLQGTYQISDQTSQNAFSEVDIQAGSLAFVYQFMDTASLSARYAYRRQEFAFGALVEENAAVIQIRKTW